MLNQSGREAMLSAVPLLQVADLSDATLLSSPIGSISMIDSIIRAKREALEVMGQGLNSCMPTMLFVFSITHSCCPRCFTP